MPDIRVTQLGDDLERAIALYARRERISREEAVKRLLRKGVQTAREDTLQAIENVIDAEVVAVLPAIMPEAPEAPEASLELATPADPPGTGLLAIDGTMTDDEVRAFMESIAWTECIEENDW